MSSLAARFERRYVSRRIRQPGPDTTHGPGAGRTVLIVEDEPIIQSLFTVSLRSAGYRVLEASNGVAAAALFDRLGDRIDLVLTDVVMPKMGGADLADYVRGRNPGVKVLFVSGFVGRVPSEPRENVLQKPFARAELLAAVARLLDE
jgi:two-component system cell cycle sensor histidine kinase/response regulator CckA